MSNHRLILLITVLLAVLLGLATFVHFQTRDLDQYRPRITQILKQITGHPVSLKKVIYAPLSGPFTLELQELEILSQDPAEPPMLQVPETLFSISPISLILGKPQLSAIKLISPQINLVLRDHTPLMERAQDTAYASDEKLIEELGFGLTELTIGQISVQNGILAILDWDHHEGRTLVFDHLQVGIHALSPMRASPVTASARYRSIPFTVNGQLGPLPDTFDPFEMPLLLSLEAKSIGLKHMEDVLSTDTIKISTSRGYLTTLLHGSLDKGLQTSTWLQLDGVQISRKDKLLQNEQKQSAKKNIIERFSQRNEKKTMDIALRQKSTIHMGWGGFPNLEFQEFFIYLDGSPILETKGWIRDQWRGPLKLDIKILNTVDLDRFPWPDTFPLKGESPSGSLQFYGIWPTTIQYSADLDLTKTIIDLPPLQKKTNIPLALNFIVSQVNDKIDIKKLLLHHPITPDHRITVKGALAPSLQLETEAQWDIERVASYFPLTKNWDVIGMAYMNMDLSNPSAQTPWQAKGELRAEQGSIGLLDFKELRIPFEVKNNQMLLPHTALVSAGGRIEILAMADLSQEPILFDSRLTLVGTNLAQLPGQPEGNEPIRLEGFLFAQASLQGQLDPETFLPTEHLFGHSHLRIEPGRLAGIDQNAFRAAPKEEAIISDVNKDLYWSRMEMDVDLLNDKMVLENILLDNAGTKLSGHGIWELTGNRWFDLQVQTDWNSSHGYKRQFSVNIEGDGITNGFRMKQKTKQ